MCKAGNHNLEIIYSRDCLYDEKTVVRWCRDCGAVVIDKEFDGRVSSGAVMPMKFVKREDKQNV